MCVERVVMDNEEWRNQKPNTWWLMFKDAPKTNDATDDRGVRWPPSMTASWGGRGCCIHMYSYYNGAMPDEPGRDDDVEYLHICDLDDLIEELQDLRASMGWERPEWDVRPVK